jgi:oligoendopeptidase F
MGVSLVDMKAWQWLYDHPDADAKQLKEAVVGIAKEVWNQYYAPVFGSNDEVILAIYSHMIDSPLYLSAYPIGHLIEFQLSGYFKDKPFAAEVERIYKLGRLTPQVWMKQAVGSEISSKTMIDAATEALKVVK